MHNRQLSQKAAKSHVPGDQSRGFTILELLIATAVFSVVLLVFLVAFLRVGELFYKGVSMTRTQETARNVLQDISDDILFYRDSPTPGVTGNYFCIGSHRYTFYSGVQVGSPSRAGIYREDVTGCPPLINAPNAQDVNTATADQLLDPGMQINKLTTVCNSGRCTIDIHVVFYGDDPTVLTPSAQDPNAQCTGSQNSTQYCATVDYSSTVLQSF